MRMKTLLGERRLAAMAAKQSDKPMVEFLNMGGYASFVWPSWLIGVAVIAGISLQSIIKSRKVKKALAVRGDK